MKPTIQSMGDSGRSGSESEQSSRYQSNTGGFNKLKDQSVDIDTEDFSANIVRIEDKESDVQVEDSRSS